MRNLIRDQLEEIYPPFSEMWDRIHDTLSPESMDNVLIELRGEVNRKTHLL